MPTICGMQASRLRLFLIRELVLRHSGSRRFDVFCPSAGSMRQRQKRDGTRSATTTKRNTNSAMLG
jgi:hypothetical protein